MYLAKLTITGFRKLKALTLQFQPGLNILVGANNIGKTAVIDALRALLAGTDDPYPRFDLGDVHQPIGGTPGTAIAFDYIFRGLSIDDEADFMPALRPDANGELEARFGVRYDSPDASGRLRVKRWCGEHEEVALALDVAANLRGVYLPPLRDAVQALRPGRNSLLSRLFQLLTDAPGRGAIEDALRKLDADLQRHDTVRVTHTAITDRHAAMIGTHLQQALHLGLSGNDFQRLASRLSLLVDNFEIDQNGLGFNNLIYMAVVLGELLKNPDAGYRSLIVEEPEAHLHPQLQSILLRYLEATAPAKAKSPLQVFVTSHSPNFASLAHLDTLSCLVDTQAGVETFSPRSASFEAGKKEKLQRYLDVTRSELFFARRIVFVEGASERMLVSVLAEKAGHELRSHAVSVISVEGLNFDSFLPLFGMKALKVPVAVITDADPTAPGESDEEPPSLFPALGDTVSPSDNIAKMKLHEDACVRVFYGLKTLEYDLALHECNRIHMIAALKELHPKIGATLEAKVASASTEAEKARILFSGMFLRERNNVQKGRFAQALAAKLAPSAAACVVPPYINDAIVHVCGSPPTAPPNGAE